MSTIASPSPQKQSKQTFNYQDYIPADSEILCPICQVQCTSLQRLNLHLDQAHNEEETKGDLISWFKNAQKKVLNPLTQKGSTSNSTPPGTSFSKSFNQILEPNFISNLSINGSQPTFTPEMEQQMEAVRRDHWQRETGQDRCSEPHCSKTVSRGSAGKQHCYHCGRIYCADHTRYEMKLNTSAKHDPEHGIWCRVCHSCYTARDGYLDNEGAIRSRTALFLMRRMKTIDRVHLESNKLEKRLEKLAKIHSSSETLGRAEKPSLLKTATLGTGTDRLSVQRTASTSSIDSIGSLLSPKLSSGSGGNRLLSIKLKNRDAEQSVVAWDDDKSVLNCPHCNKPFTITNRRHHCRLCGRIVCSNQTCSSMVPLFLDMSSDSVDQPPVGETRACKDCKRMVFRRKIQKEEMTKPQPILQLYQQLSATKANIDKMLPRFQDMVMMLERNEISNQSHETFKLAGQVRKSLLDSFAAFDAISKRINMLPAHSSSMRRLQANIHIAANHYLQRNMFPLQMLPRILNPDSKSKKGSKANGRTRTPSPHAQAEIDDLNAQLAAFEEQKSLVAGFVKEAQRQRKFDDVRTLKVSLSELEGEIDRLRTELLKLS
ncbi:FYVE zinc finger-domain-containing protein [Umbelopsis sp. PMI_123]|nr:FYVE zinc finger-domain-containing protein [Umbelopsis sp. PMI_123]